MKHAAVLGVLLSLGLLGALVLLFFIPTRVQLLLVNGAVTTLDSSLPVAEAVAIDDGTIVAVGSSKELLDSYRAESVLDLGGRPVYPGFIDAHAHVEGFGAALNTVNLSGTRSIEEVQERLAGELQRRPDAVWIRGRGWDQNDWPATVFPHHASLDAVTATVPVYFKRIDGHAVWVNRRILEIAGISRNTADPEGGRIIRDARGEPTGVFVDNAMALLDSVLPPPSRGERRAAIERALGEFIRYGLTEIHDMGVDSEAVGIYRELFAQGKLPVRIYAALDGTGEVWEQYRHAGPAIDVCDGFLSIRSVKLYADGALGSRGAALIQPYADDPSTRGLTLASRDELVTATVEALTAGFQTCVHAIGDRANAVVLDAYEEAFRSSGRTAQEARLRIEHAQILDARDVARFRALSVLPVMQPTHCTSDMPWAVARLGRDRLAGAYAWRSLLKTGSIIPLGSDVPVESPNPLWGFYAAITRQDLSGWPEGGWFPEQKMTREEALRGMTTWPAFASFHENTKGVLAPGMWADLTVLSDDIMTLQVTRIPSTQVVLTVVGGRIVYDAEAMSSLPFHHEGARHE